MTAPLSSSDHFDVETDDEDSSSSLDETPILPAQWIEEEPLSTVDKDNLFIKKASKREPNTRQNVFDSVLFGSKRKTRSSLPPLTMTTMASRPRQSNKNKRVEPAGTVRQDTIHRSDIRTGLLEDTLITCLLAVEYVFGTMRSIVNIFIDGRLVLFDLLFVVETLQRF
jgi:hypothetical protein